MSKANRKIRRARERAARRGHQALLNAVKEQVAERQAYLQRYSQMLGLADEARKIATQIQVPDPGPDHNPETDGDPGAVRKDFIETATKKFNEAAELFAATALDLHDFLAELDNGVSDIEVVPGNAVQNIQ